MLFPVGPQRDQIAQALALTGVAGVARFAGEVFLELLGNERLGRGGALAEADNFGFNIMALR
jgi:hypothetical protein